MYVPLECGASNIISGLAIIQMSRKMTTSSITKTSNKAKPIITCIVSRPELNHQLKTLKLSLLKNLAYNKNNQRQLA